jgi:hypothetical protein
MSQTPSSTASPLTVVLVHGAFADASSRTGVIERLQVGRDHSGRAGGRAQAEGAGGGGDSGKRGIMAHALNRKKGRVDDTT